MARGDRGAGEGMISAVYLINLKGEVLIFRSYRDDVSRTAADAFRMQVRLPTALSSNPLPRVDPASHIRGAPASEFPCMPLEF